MRLFPKYVKKEKLVCFVAKYARMIQRSRRH